MRHGPLALLVVALPLFGAGSTTPVTLNAFAAGRDATPLAYGPTAAGAGSPVVAANDGRFLVAWVAGGIPQLFLSAADATGRLTTPVGTWLAGDVSTYPTFQVLPFGKNYVVTWQDTFRGPRAAEVTPDVQVVRTFAMPASGRVAWNGSVFAIVSDSLTLADSNGVIIKKVALDRGGNLQTDVATFEGDFLVLSYITGTSIQRIDSQGVVVWKRTIAAPLVVTNDPKLRRTFMASVASNGSTAAVAWISGSYSPQPADALFVSTVASNGDVVTKELAIGYANNALSSYALRIIPHGSGYAVLSIAGYKATSTIQNPVDNIIHLVNDSSPEGPFLVADGSLPSIASNGTTIYAARPEQVSTPSGTRFRIAGGPLALNTREWQPVEISTTARRHWQPRLISDGVGFAGAWLDHSMTDANLSVAALSQYGTAENVTSTPVATSYSYFHAMASNGTVDLVVWPDHVKLWGRRFATNGVPIDSAPFVIRDGVNLPVAVASDGQRFLTVWSDNTGLYGVLVSRDGGVSESIMLAADASSFLPTDPKIAWNGTEYLLTWAAVYRSNLICSAFCSSASPDVHAIRISRDGKALDPKPITLAQNVAATQVASDGRGFLVVMDAADISQMFTNVIGRYVRTAGDTLVADPPVTLFRWAGRAATDVSFNGTEYVTAIRYGTNAESWLAAIHISSSLFTTSRRYASVERSDGFFDIPAIASNNIGDSILAVTESRPGVGIPRVRTYVESELDTLPSPPMPPVVRSAVATGSKLTITWTPSATETHGYLLETRSTYGPEYYMRSEIVTSPLVITRDNIDSVRIRAIGVGGVSEASTPVNVTFTPRERAVRK